MFGQLRIPNRLVLGEVQGRQPSPGTLVLAGDCPIKVKLGGKYKKVRRIVEVLRRWTNQLAGDAPPVVLNKHCPSCPFRDVCLQHAEKEDNLNRVVRVQPRRKCPKGHGDLALDSEGMSTRTVTDLCFTRNGCRKTVTRYEGRKAHCPKCGKPCRSFTEGVCHERFRRRTA